MARYSRLDLTVMAIQALTAKREGDPRYQELVERVCVRTGMSQADVEVGIQKLASGG